MDNMDFVNDIINEDELDNESYEYYRQYFIMNYGGECQYCNKLYGLTENSEVDNCCLNCYNNLDEEEMNETDEETDAENNEENNENKI